MSARDLPRLYVITDRARTKGRDVVDVVDAALQGAPALVQLREKDLEGAALMALASRLLVVVRARASRLLINDRVDVALAVGADGVHLPEHGFPIADARRLLGADALIGVSTHNLSSVDKATAAGADFMVCGPVWATPSKPGASGFGIEGLGEAVRRADRIPVYALGGVSAPERAAACVTANAYGVAGIGAFMEAENPCVAASAMLDAVARPMAPL